MAYYTFAHIIQRGDMFGKAAGPIPAEKLTDAVFDHVMLGEPLREPLSAEDGQVVATMKREFDFWYPFDLRVSGKDLIQNHLTFCLYNHTAVWADKPEMWPLGLRCNGHVMIN